MKPKINIYIIILFLINILEVKAQDVHYSQFHNVILYQSPALSGLMIGDYRLNAAYRMQWESVPVQYRTYALGYDMKIRPQKMKNGALGAGIILQRDQAGDSNLAMTSAMISMSYMQAMSKKSVLSMGFNFGAAQRSFDYNNLTFDSQFNGDIFVPSSSTGEVFNNTNYIYLDLGAGLNYRFQKNKRTVFDLGVAGHHFNTPKQTFREDNDSELPIRITAYFNSSFQLAKKSDLLLRALIHRQLTYSQYAAGLGWRYHLSQKKNKETALSFNAHYRWADAVIPMLELEYGPLKIGASYDINISGFRRATNGNGGFEITAIYIFTKVEPLPYFKACPTF